MTFLELAHKVLSEEKRPLSPSEIWKLAVSKGYDQLLGSKKGKTPWQSLSSIILVDHRNNPKTNFIKVGARPARYYLNNLPGAQEPAELESKLTSAKTISSRSLVKERDLHQFLSYFVHGRFNAYSKTIGHNKSPKKEFGQWVHPDVIEVYFPIQDWASEVFEFSKAIGSIAVKLYSFEIKRELSFGNLRKSFCQTVSNSSWAHEGYLVASDIDTDEDFLAELRRLSTSFGIGIIQLDIEDPDSSEIVVPARERDALAAR